MDISVQSFPMDKAEQGWWLRVFGMTSISTIIALGLMAKLATGV